MSSSGEVTTIDEPTQEEISRISKEQNVDLNVAKDMAKSNIINNYFTLADGQGAVDTIKKMALTGAY